MEVEGKKPTLWKKFLKTLAKAAVSGVVGGSVGWILRMIFSSFRNDENSPSLQDSLLAGAIGGISSGVLCNSLGGSVKVSFCSSLFVSGYYNILLILSELDYPVIRRFGKGEKKTFYMIVFSIVVGLVAPFYCDYKFRTELKDSFGDR